ncbi:hypothetical protein AB9F40_33845, partial [Rhizobium leguminosarum]
VEAGSVAAEMSPVELSAIVSDSAELYEPAAEEAGLGLSSSIEPDVEVQGNRELIGQAIFNSALKVRINWSDSEMMPSSAVRRVSPSAISSAS